MPISLWVLTGCLLWNLCTCSTVPLNGNSRALNDDSGMLEELRSLIEVVEGRPNRPETLYSMVEVEAFKASDHYRQLYRLEEHKLNPALVEILRAFKTVLAESEGREVFRFRVLSRLLEEFWQEKANFDEKVENLISRIDSSRLGSTSLIDLAKLRMIQVLRERPFDYFCTYGLEAAILALHRNELFRAFKNLDSEDFDDSELTMLHADIEELLEWWGEEVKQIREPGPIKVISSVIRENLQKFFVKFEGLANVESRGDLNEVLEENFIETSIEAEANSDAEHRSISASSLTGHEDYLKIIHENCSQSSFTMDDDDVKVSYAYPRPGTTIRVRSTPPNPSQNKQHKHKREPRQAKAKKFSAASSKAATSKSLNEKDSDFYSMPSWMAVSIGVLVGSCSILLLMYFKLYKKK